MPTPPGSALGWGCTQSAVLILTNAGDSYNREPAPRHSETFGEQQLFVSDGLLEKTSDNPGEVAFVLGRAVEPIFAT